MLFAAFYIKPMRTRCFQPFSPKPNLQKFKNQKKTWFRLGETMIFLAGWSSKVSQSVKSRQTISNRTKTCFHQVFQRNNLGFEPDRFDSQTVQNWSETGQLGGRFWRQSALKVTTRAAQSTEVVRMVLEKGRIGSNLTNFTDRIHENSPPKSPSKIKKKVKDN